MISFVVMSFVLFSKSLAYIIGRYSFVVVEEFFIYQIVRSVIDQLIGWFITDLSTDGQTR